MNKTGLCFTLLFKAAGMHLPFHTNIDHHSPGNEKGGVGFPSWAGWSIWAKLFGWGLELESYCNKFVAWAVGGCGAWLCGYWCLGPGS